MENQTTEQAPAASVEDRVASIFGATPEPQKQEPTQVETEAVEASPEAPQETEPEAIEWEYEGEKYLVPKKLEKALLQEKDYTQKSQELADIRRTVEVKEQQIRLASMQQEFQKSVSKEVRDLGLYDAAIAEASQVNWAQMTTDEVIRKKLEIDQWKDQREALAKSLQAKEAEFHQNVQGEFQKLKAASEETLKKRIQNWSPELVKQISESAKRDGYTDAELSQLIDPRHVTTLWKAHMYDLSQSKASEAVKAVKTAAVQVKSSRPMDAKTKEYLNYRKEVSKFERGSLERNKLAENRAAKLFGG